MTPAGTPIRIETTIAESVSSTVGSARSMIASRTGVRRKIDGPRSARSKRPYQPTSCWSSGSSSPSVRRICATSSAGASGPAMIAAGSPGARWISTNPTVATTSATGTRARRRRRTYAFTRGARSFREPDVEERLLVRVQHAAQVLRVHLEAEPVAELDAADVFVEELLHLLPHRLALARVGLALHAVEPPLLVLETPPARPVALHAGIEPRLGVERDRRREHVPELGLVAALDERRPVDDLQVDLEPHALELLLGDERVLVHVVVFLGRDPAHGLARVARVLQELLRLLGVPLVVELAADLRMPLRLLDVHQARIHAVEGLVAERRGHDRLHVEGGLQRLADALVRHEALLVIQDTGGPRGRLDDAHLEPRHVLETLVLILLDLLSEVILAALDAGHAHGDVGHGHEQDLVEVRGAAAAVEVWRVRARRVVLEARELDVAGRLVDRKSG